MEYGLIALVILAVVVPFAAVILQEFLMWMFRGIQ